MAVAVYTSDLTTLISDDTSNIANWVAIGGGKSGLNIETDYFIQGASCVSKDAFASATKGMIETGTGTALTLGTLDAVYAWITHTTPGSLDTKANGGMRIVIGSSGSTYNSYYYAGKDTIDYGAPWICAVIDPENATASLGTVSPSSMSAYGGVAKLIGGPTKGSPLGIDAIRQGRSYNVTNGDSANPATFLDAAIKNDLQANRYGQFQGVPGISGAYTMQCRFGIGTATTAAYFDDSNFSISINDLEYVNTNFQEIEILNANTTCKWTGGTISAVGVNSKGNFKATSSLLIEHTSMTFNDMGTFNYDSNSTVKGTKFIRCGLVTQGGGTFTSCTIDSPTGTVGISVDNLNTVTKCTFNSDGTGHALDIGTISSNTSLNYDNTDTGYTDATSGNETILVNVNNGITLTINVASGASTPSVYNIGTGIVNVVSGQVTTTITVKDIVTGAVLQGARVYLVGSGGALDGVVIFNTLTDANGQVSDTRSLSANQNVVGRVRYSTSPNFYKTTPISEIIDNANGLILNVALIKDI